MVSIVEFTLLFAAEGVSLTLKQASIANNSFVDVDNIGVDDDALLCRTDRTDCCGSTMMNQIRTGEWHFPCNQESGVGTLGNPPRNDAFYRDRGPSVVRLNRRGSPSERGCFGCELLNVNNVIQMIFVNIGMFFST